MQIITDFQLDVSRSMPMRQYVAIRQGDSGIRMLRITLMHNGSAIKVPEDTTVILRGYKPDGTKTMVDGIVSDGRLLFTITPQMSAVVGDVLCDVQIIKRMDVLTSIAFELRVEKQVVSEEDITSSDEWSLLAKLLEDMKNLGNGGNVTAYSYGNTETISMSVSNTRTYIAEMDVRIEATIPINNDDIKVKINNTTTADIAACYINLSDGSYIVYSGNFNEEIDLTQYDGVVSLMIGFYAPTGANEILEAIITSSQSTISADVKEGSIKPEHLAEEYYTKEEVSREIEDVEAIAKGRATGYVFDTVEDLDTWLSDEANKANLVLGDNFYIRTVDVPDYWWDGSEKQQLETQKVDLTEYVKNTDYATDTVGGVVKVKNYAHGLSIGPSGTIQVYPAERSDINAKVALQKPICVSTFDYAVTLGTHQTMSDDYDPMTLKVNSSLNGIQGQLPVSYDAAKNYVDGLVGNIDSALDELHAYAQALVSGGES